MNGTEKKAPKAFLFCWWVLKEVSRLVEVPDSGPNDVEVAFTMAFIALPH